MADIDFHNVLNQKDNAAAAASQAHNEAGRNLLADTFKMPEASSHMSANIANIAEGGAMTMAGAGVGAAGGYALTKSVGVMYSFIGPFMGRSMSACMEDATAYGMRAIVPKYAAVGALAGLGLYGAIKGTEAGIDKYKDWRSKH